MKVITPHPILNELDGRTGRGVRVGVVDSGWDRSVADPRIVSGTSVQGDGDIATYTSDDQDRLGHGTACGDVILRRAPQASIVPVRVFDTRLETSPMVIVHALRWCCRNDIQVVNLSLGTIREDAVRALYETCEMARASNTIIVAAAHRSRRASFPAVFDNVIGVGAARIDCPISIAYEDDAAVECMAKGVHDDVRWLRVTRRVGGTSFAAATVTGMVALLLEGRPGLDLHGVRSLLKQYAAR